MKPAVVGYEEWTDGSPWLGEGVARLEWNSAAETRPQVGPLPRPRCPWFGFPRLRSGQVAHHKGETGVRGSDCHPLQRVLAWNPNVDEVGDDIQRASPEVCS